MVKHLENQMCKGCKYLEQHTPHWCAAAGIRISEFMVRITSVGMFSAV